MKTQTIKKTQKTHKKTKKTKTKQELQKQQKKPQTTFLYDNNCKYSLFS